MVLRNIIGCAFCIICLAGCKPNPEVAAIVRWDSVAVRAWPSQAAPQLGKLDHGSTVTLLERSENHEVINSQWEYWYRINFWDQQGWVFGANLRFELTAFGPMDEIDAIPGIPLPGYPLPEDYLGTEYSTEPSMPGPLTTIYDGYDPEENFGITELFFKEGCQSGTDQPCTVFFLEKYLVVGHYRRKRRIVRLLEKPDKHWQVYGDTKSCRSQGGKPYLALFRYAAIGCDRADIRAAWTVELPSMEFKALPPESIECPPVIPNPCSRDVPAKPSL